MCPSPLDPVVPQKFSYNSQENGYISGTEGPKDPGRVQNFRRDHSTTSIAQKCISITHMTIFLGTLAKFLVENGGGIQ